MNFDWDEEKNGALIDERGISFEGIVDAIKEGKLLDNIEHPNQKKYPGQRLYIVEIDNYAYIIPFVEDEEKIFFKTIIPSRKATKKYLIKENKK